MLLAGVEEVMELAPDELKKTSEKESTKQTQKCPNQCMVHVKLQWPLIMKGVTRESDGEQHTKFLAPQSRPWATELK